VYHIIYIHIYTYYTGREPTYIVHSSKLTRRRCYHRCRREFPRTTFVCMSTNRAHVWFVFIFDERAAVVRVGVVESASLFSHAWRGDFARQLMATRVLHAACACRSIVAVYVMWFDVFLSFIRIKNVYRYKKSSLVVS